MALLTATQIIAATTAIADERALRDRPERGEGHRKVGQRDPHGRTTAIARLWAGIATTGAGTATNFFDLEQHRP